MKRDMDLARAILLALEESNEPHTLLELEIPDVSPAVVSYHVKLLHQAGLIEAYDASGTNMLRLYPQRLTWQGHEFLDAARNDTLWNKAKNLVFERTGSLTFAAVQAALLEMIKKSVTGS